MHAKMNKAYLIYFSAVTYRIMLSTRNQRVGGLILPSAYVPRHDILSMIVSLDPGVDGYLAVICSFNCFSVTGSRG